MRKFFMWIEGVPGRPGWDGWFEVGSFSFGNAPSMGGGAAVRPTPIRTANVSKRIDASSSAIFLRCVHGDTDAASLWMSGENDVPLYQVDMTDAMVTACWTGGSDSQRFQLSFAKADWRRATNP